MEGKIQFKILPPTIIAETLLRKMLEFSTKKASHLAFPIRETPNVQRFNYWSEDGIMFKIFDLTITVSTCTCYLKGGWIFPSKSEFRIDSVLFNDWPRSLANLLLNSYICVVCECASKQLDECVNTGLL